MLKIAPFNKLQNLFIFKDFFDLIIIPWTELNATKNKYAPTFNITKNNGDPRFGGSEGKVYIVGTNYIGKLRRYTTSDTK